MTYDPPFWLFWVLLGIAIGVAIFLTYLDLRKKPEADIVNIPTLLNRMGKHLGKKVKSKVKRVRREGKILELNGVLKSCMAVLGVTKELPKPKKIPITDRYRESIHNKIPQDIKEQMLDKNRSWELNMRIGGMLDRRKYGLQIEDDVKYDKYKTKLNDITKHYIGVGSKKLTKQKNNYLIRSYASYSYLLFIGYWEILVDFAKDYGVDNLALPEAESFLSLRNEGVERYLSEELEKVKSCIADILKQRKPKNEHE